MRALPLKNFAACVAVLVSLVAAATSFAADKSLKLQVAEIATSFIEPLPMDKKYVLKSLSPDATGIPEDFLRKLTSDVEAGLLFASDNEMNLINRDATEEIWQEATEFNSAQFQELYAKSSADVMIMISPRLTADGVEISLTAYELTGEDVGKVLASSGTSVLAMDVKATLGVDVNDITSKMDTLLEKIDDSEKPTPIKAEVAYFRFVKNKKIPDVGCNAPLEWSDCFSDGIGASVNGQDMVATNGNDGEWDEIFWAGDIDNDGYFDALIRGQSLGNAIPPSLRVISYRGEGRFEVYEIDRAYSWEDPRVIQEGSHWLIRVNAVSEGMGNTTLDDSMSEVRLINGAIVYKAVGSKSRTFSQFEFTSKEVEESYDGSQDFKHVWSDDFDGNGIIDTIACGYWERWGRLWECQADINATNYNLGDNNCKIVSLNFTDSGEAQFLCDGVDATTTQGPVTLGADDQSGND